MSLRLDEIARVAARLARPFASREEVLRAAGLDEASWETEKARLREAIGELPLKERHAMARAFRLAFANADAPLLQSRPSVPGPSASLPEGAGSPSTAEVRFSVAVPRQLPSYLREPPATPVAAPSASYPQQRPAVVTETEDLDDSPAAGKRSVTSSSPLAWNEPRPTIMASQLPATARPVPFTSTEQAIPPPPTGPAFQSGFTVAARPLPRKSLPFRRDAGPAAAPPAGWDIERYGRLCIDLVRLGLEEGQVLHKAGLSADQRRSLDRYWEDRMFAEPELRLVWKQACDRRVAEIERGLW